MTLLPEVEHALMTAIGEAEPARRSRGSRRPGRRLLGPAATVAMVCVSLAIFVGALVLLHRGTAPGPSHGAASQRPTVASTRGTLLATLGVLRRPEHGPKVELTSLPLFGINPTAPLPGRPQRHLTLDPALTRTVAPPGFPYGVALLAVREGATRSAPATEGLDVILSHRHDGSRAIRLPLYETGPQSVSSLRSRGVALVPAGSSNSGVVVVPDGVARVQIGPGSPSVRSAAATASAAPSGCRGRSPP